MLHLIPQEEETFLKSHSTSAYRPKPLSLRSIIQASDNVPVDDKGLIQEVIDSYLAVFSRHRIKSEHHRTPRGYHHYHKKYPCTHLCIYISKISELIPVVCAAKAAECQMISLLTDRLDPTFIYTAASLGVKNIYKVSSLSQVVKHFNSLRPSVDHFMYSGVHLPVLENSLNASKIEYRHLRPPKEVVVIGHNPTPVQDLAADLFYLIGQQHCPKVYFITNSMSYAAALDNAMSNMLSFLKNKQDIISHLPNINTIVTKSKQSIVDICNAISPEELIILAHSAGSWYSNRIHSCSSVYIGRFLPKSLAGYIGGMRSKPSDHWVSAECVCAELFVKQVHENYLEEEFYHHLSHKSEKMAILEQDHTAVLSINIRKIQYPK